MSKMMPPSSKIQPSSHVLVLNMVGGGGNNGGNRGIGGRQKNDFQSNSFTKMNLMIQKRISVDAATRTCT